MWSKKDYIIFFAGVEAFHTLCHIIISISGTLPIQFFFITWTQPLNIIGIVVNAVITLGLLWWASRLKCCQ
jgi:hypothetical protein